MSERFGRRTFRVDVDEYADCFDALLNGRPFHTDDAPPRVRRVRAAYQHIEAHFPARLRGELLTLFVDWLLYRVSVVAMHAGDHERAVEMFQSMNDRGVHLSPMDHLKRFLLSDHESDPRELEGKWNTMVSSLERIERGAAFAYIRTVLRSRFPEAAKRPGPSLAEATHEWMLEQEDVIWPHRRNGDRARLFTEVLYPLHVRYGTLLRARSRLDPALRAVRFNAVNGIHDQFDLTLAALRPEDPPAVSDRKAAMVANLIDLFYVTQMLDGEPVDQKSVDGLVAEVMPAVHSSTSEDDLRRELGARAADWPDRLVRVADLRYDGDRRFLHYVLARLTAWVEIGGGGEDPSERLLAGDHEIEHLFTSDFSKYRHLVPDASFYSYLRNRVGALMLLNRSENRSYGKLALADKLVHYRKDSLLAGLLSADFLDKGGVTLKRYLKKHGLHVPTYDSTAALEPFIEARGRFLVAIAQRAWSLAELGLAPAGPPSGKRTSHGIRVADLVKAGLITANAGLVGQRKRQPYRASVLRDGGIRTASGSVFASPTAAMTDAVGVASNGWTFWRVEPTMERLDEVRTRYLDRFAS